MVKTCLVSGCNSEWYPGCNLKFHRFPKNIIRRNTWLSILPLKGKYYESATICSLHFSPQDYEFHGNRLKQDAQPKHFYPNDTITMTSNPQEGILQELNLELPSTSKLSLQSNTVDPLLRKRKQPMPLDTSLSKRACTLEEYMKVENCGVQTFDPLLRKRKQPMPPDTSPSKKSCTLEEAIEGESCDVQVDRENIPPKTLKDSSVQVKIKTKLETNLQKKVKILSQKVKRRDQSLHDVKSVLDIVKKYASRSEIENIIDGNFSDICKHFKKPETHPQGKRYSEEVKAFALTLHFYSPKAYEFLRKNVSLPHVQTLRRSLSKFNCNVGFLNEVLEFLKQEVEINGKVYLKNVALIFDAMSLKQDLAYDQKLDKVFGYVDLGGIPLNEPEQLASEALVFQIVSYTNNFKCPIGYFFIHNSLTGELLAELLNTAIALLHEIGITVRSLTCDGASSNIKAYENLGCSLSEENFRPYFLHPNGHTHIYCLLDAVHMLKLARNVLADFTISTNTGNTSFEYIKKLHKVQEKEGLKFANKLNSMHVNFKNKKMNVRLAAQVLSSSVADAVDFLRASGNSEFNESESTVEFLRVIDRLFDLMNTKSPYGTGYQSPLSLKNQDYWQSIFDASKDYLKSLTINGRNILSHGRKTFALGFLMNIESLSALTLDLTKEKILKYFLTYKCSQDNLEIFFSCIRARGRTQDNPSPLEFRLLLRKMLFRNSIQPSLKANCVDNDYESSYVFEHNNQMHKNLVESTQIEESECDVEKIMENLDTVETSPYQENILYYITGYIVKQINSHTTCAQCRYAIISNDNFETDHLYSLNINKYHSFTSFVNRGKLYFPSVAAFQVVKHSDILFKRASRMNILNTDNIRNKLITMVVQNFYPKLRQMFDHISCDSITCSDPHEIKLVKQIANLFLKMRLRTHLKGKTDATLGLLRGKRQKLHKTVLFSHI